MSPRRPKAVTYVDSRIAQLKDVPDKDADADALIEHSMKVVDVRACHNYDTIRQYCYWCLSHELLFTDAGVRGGLYKWCSERCRDANAARRKLYNTPIDHKS